MPNDLNLSNVSDLALDTDADTGLLIATLAQQATNAQQLNEGVHAVLQADGSITIVETPGYAQQREKEWADANAETPTLLTKSATVVDVTSFLAFLAAHTAAGDGEVGEGSLFSLGGLEVWADIDNATVLGVIDGVDGWRRQQVTLRLRKSREWGEWMGVDGKLFTQHEFAEFIEDHLSTIAEPDGAKLLDICQTLQATKGVNFKSQTILASGQRQLRYEETVEAKAGQKGDLMIPDTLTLVVRPFQGSDPVAITARFRFRLNDGALRLGVKLAEPERVLEEAFDRIVADVANGVPVPVLFGRP